MSFETKLWSYEEAVEVLEDIYFIQWDVWGIVNDAHGREILKDVQILLDRQMLRGGITPEMHVQVYAYAKNKVRQFYRQRKEP